MLEIYCPDLVFHFNKKHLEDPSVPPWTIKTRGETFYVNHVTSNIPWTTKETPNNNHTKGSIKLKKAILKISDLNEAEIALATDADVRRLKARAKGYVRILWAPTYHATVTQYLKIQEIAHTTILSLSGSCGRYYYVTDIKSNDDVVAMELAINSTFRRLVPNDIYYKAYDNPSILEDDLEEQDEDNP